jgi:pimeloyl-ACP methyl ester carboxylesterase
MSAPFEQLKYADVPELPRRPHRYADARAETVSFVSKPFGPVDVHVRTYGNGPPLLLVHGFMTSSYSWRYVFAALGDRYTLVAPDLIGSGRSSKPDHTYDAGSLATSIGETIDALGLRGVPTVGNSLGGYLCMRLALEDAGAIGRLVNLHSPGVVTPRMTALKWAMRLVPAADAVVRRLVWHDPERWVHRNVHYWDETLKSREEQREYAAPLKTDGGILAFARMLRNTLDPDAMRAFEAELRARGRFPIPLLLVYAERDPMVPPEVGDRLHALLPDAGFVRLADASHFAHVDATDRFVAAILPFLAGGPT